jgi:hypothetical protein
MRCGDCPIFHPLTGMPDKAYCKAMMAWVDADLAGCQIKLYKPEWKTTSDEELPT